MPKTKLIPHDTAVYLTTPKKRALYLEAMIEESDNDPAAILLALSTIARSEGMTNVARKSKLSRENLYRSLSGDKKPEFGTILKVMDAVGLQFHVVAKTAKATKATEASRADSRPRALSGAIRLPHRRTP